MRLNVRKGNLAAKFNLEETLEEIDPTQGTEKDIFLRQLRVVVCENSYAQAGLELPRELFRGPMTSVTGLQKATSSVFSPASR